MHPASYKALVLCVVVLFIAVLSWVGLSSHLSSKEDADKVPHEPDIRQNELLLEFIDEGYGYVDGGTSSTLTETIERACEDTPSDATKNQCIAYFRFALKGTGDCDSFVADDPDVCFDDGLNCAAKKYSACAPCVHPVAPELIDDKDTTSRRNKRMPPNNYDYGSAYNHAYTEHIRWYMNESDGECTRPTVPIYWCRSDETIPFPFNYPRDLDNDVYVEVTPP